VIYHDPAKSLAIVFTPMELNLKTEERERLIGDMTNALMRSLPEEAPKGYLLQPHTALTMQGLIEQVLEADGVSREMLDAERKKADLINELADADQEQREKLLADNAGLIDEQFLELMALLGQSLSQAGQSRRALRLLNIRSQLLESTEAGKAIKAREQAVKEANEDLKKLGQNLTRETLVDLLVKNKDNPVKIEAIGQLVRPALDYTVFQMLATRIDATADASQKQQLIDVRETLLRIQANYEQQARAVMQRASDTLRSLLTAPDLLGAIQMNLNRIDDTFMQVLQANLEEARRTGNVEISTRLKQIRDEILKLVQASSPPEIQLINELLSAPTPDDSLALLQERSEQVNADLVSVMWDLVEQLQEANPPAAERLSMIAEAAEGMVAG
jgi:hypothetical protein